MIALGHPPAAVWGYTPRQINGLLQIAEERARRDRADRLYVAAMGARGDIKEIRKLLKEWTR